MRVLDRQAAVLVLAEDEMASMIVYGYPHHSRESAELPKPNMSVVQCFVPVAGCEDGLRWKATAWAIAHCI